MNIIKVGLYTVAYQRQGNDKNGNPMYFINVFKDITDKGGTAFYNVNYRQQRKLDKHGNIKCQSYNIDGTIDFILNEIEFWTTTA